ncbi:hypothetical protein C7H08_04065 [Marinobacter halophilus]|uniref:Uncharacterized protein n=1 Tax=Marinobacter halophilus TaxID=1323740 RepID=A0A2T1KHS0_9GAMM|nr:hypothetical protein C7H08_04065 [Marinobacter halophilus]
MRVGSFIFVVVGLLGAFFSFLEFSGASLPYQDATPEMLEQQSASIQFWGASLLANLFLLIVGGWGLWRSRRKN